MDFSGVIEPGRLCMRWMFGLMCWTLFSSKKCFFVLIFRYVLSTERLCRNFCRNLMKFFYSFSLFTLIKPDCVIINANQEHRPSKRQFHIKRASVCACFWFQDSINSNKYYVLKCVALSKGDSQDFLDPVLERNTTQDIGKGSPSGERDLKNHQLNSLLDQVSSPVRRELVSRASFGMRTPGNNDEIDVESGRPEKDREKTVRSKKGITLHNQALLSGLAYCFSSCSMILVNKYVLSSYDFNAGISLMLYQNFVSVIIVTLLSFLGLITTEPLTWRLIKVWFPVNVIFVGMLITSMFSLKYINVAMVTVLKNVTNVITAVGEMYLFNKHHDNRVWAALFLMIISAISGGITDLSFHAVGYTWQFMNCCLTASYSLTLRRIMDTAKQVTKSGELNEFSMVLLNNCLSLPLGIFLIFVFSEVDYLLHTPLLRLPTFWLVITFSGFLGLAISFTSMWFLHQTGATTYSLVGSLNKIPLSVTGILLFKVPTSLENSASIFFGLLAGVLFARAKMR